MTQFIPFSRDQAFLLPFDIGALMNGLACDPAASVSVILSRSVDAEEAMGAALEIWTDLASPVRLRRLARLERNPRTASRMLAIASALEGMSRAEAARLVGMERQALRDAVVRYNAEGLDGLRDRPKAGRIPTLTEAEQALVLNAVFRGPNRAEDGGVEPGRAGLAVPARALPLASAAQGLQGHRRRLLRGVERPDPRAPPISVRVPMAHRSQFIGSAV
jgi:hypothetical protein